MESAFLLLGTNLGDRLHQLDSCRQKLANIGVLGSVSGIYETAPWGISDQPEFWNKAVELKTTQSPQELLTELKRIEQECGRQVTSKWGPREIDIDILIFGSRKLQLAELIIPHPRLQDRRFALMPLEEIASNVLHPGLEKTVKQMLSECTDNLSVQLKYF